MPGPKDEGGASCLTSGADGGSILRSEKAAAHVSFPCARMGCWGLYILTILNFHKILSGMQELIYNFINVTSKGQKG